MPLSQLLQQIIRNIGSFTWGNVFMVLLAAGLLWLAFRGKRPALFLIPIAAGCLLANAGAGQVGAFLSLSQKGLQSGLLPLFVLAGLGTLIDFEPLFRSPRLVWMALVAQPSVYIVIILATLMRFQPGDAVAIGMIGALNWPAAVFVAAGSTTQILAPVALAAYVPFYLVPAFQTPLGAANPQGAYRRSEETHPRPRWVLYALPVAITFFAGFFARQSALPVGALMLGNLLRAAGEENRLASIVRKELTSAALLLLGLAIGASMTADTIFRMDTLKVLVLALIAIPLDVLVGLALNRLLGSRGFDPFLPIPFTGCSEPDEPRENSIAAIQLGGALAGGILLTVLNLI